MLPILEQLPSLKKRAMPLSIKAWHQMIDKGLAPERAELIRGVIIEKMSKSILHTKLSSRLFRILQLALGPEFWVRKEDPLTFLDSEPEPDISVIEGAETDYDTHPSTAHLVVEVSVSTLPEDRAMADIYSEAGVAEYWIVNATERCIEVSRDLIAGVYQTQIRIAEDGIVECAALPGVRLNVSELFAGLPLKN
ncbi:MAG: Uma2 family endonuclease [Prosthecobacter sp.]